MPTEGRPCSIARALDVLGERWTLLVLRELVFGTSRFDAIAAATGAPRDMLTRRLRRLEETGLIRRERYQDHPPRHAYLLTDIGRDAAEVLLTLMRFGDRHLAVEAPVRWHHGDPEHPHLLDPALICCTCGQPAGDGLHDPVGPGAPAVRPSAG